MPVNQNIRDYITRELLATTQLSEFETQFEIVVTDIAALLSARPEDAQHTSAWLAYSLSLTHMRSANETTQLSYAEVLTSVFRRVYNSPAFIARISVAQDSYPMLLNFYHLHHAFIMNGLRAPEGPQTLDFGDALRLLQVIVGAAHGPWSSRIRLQGGIRDYYYARVVDDNQGTRMELGRTAFGVRHALALATWNMQGSSETTDSKWRTYVLPLARRNNVVALQEAGIRPASALHVADLFVADQFGTLYRVEQYLWEAGSTSRPEQYHVFFLDVQRLRVNLSLVVASAGEIEVVTPRIISDGLPNADGTPVFRPALGLEVRWRETPEQRVSVYSFHAISGGGINAPRMLREVSWHTPTRFVLAGDFNRDPGVDRPGSTALSANWISPPDIAQLVVPESATHPSTQPVSTLDYAVVNGSSGTSPVGRVSTAGPSDHLAASFQFTFAG